MKQIVTALIVLVVLVCFFEIGLRVYDSHTGQVTRCELFDQGMLTKSRFCHHEFKPLLRLNIPGQGTDPDFPFDTNSQGLRGAEIVVPKPEGTYRIICLGDERTAGIDVAEADTFCQQMQEFAAVPTEIDGVAARPGGSQLGHVGCVGRLLLSTLYDDGWR